MDQSLINAVFVPKSNKMEAKADTTTRVAREIIDTETARREAKTERLRIARMAQELAEAETQAPPPARKKAAVAKRSK